MSDEVKRYDLHLGNGYDPYAYMKEIEDGDYVRSEDYDREHEAREAADRKLDEWKNLYREQCYELSMAKRDKIIAERERDEWKQRAKHACELAEEGCAEIRAENAQLREDRDLWRQSEEDCKRAYDELLDERNRLRKWVRDAKQVFKANTEGPTNLDQHTLRNWIRGAQTTARSMLSAPDPDTPEQGGTCRWVVDEIDWYQTACGHQLDNEEAYISWRYCPWCRKPIEITGGEDA
jgi:hypothetical protein